MQQNCITFTFDINRIYLAIMYFINLYLNYSK